MSQNESKRNKIRYYNSLRHKHSLTYKVWFGFFVLWHINLCRLFNAKDTLLEEL